MPVEYLLVSDMAGAHCARAIAAEIRKLQGVQAVHVNPSDKSVRVDHDGSIELHTLVRAIYTAGYRQVAVLA